MVVLSSLFIGAHPSRIWANKNQAPMAIESVFYEVLAVTINRAVYYVASDQSHKKVEEQRKKYYKYKSTHAQRST